MQLRTTVSRSRNMSAIRSKYNKTTECALVTIFRKSGISGWRRHSKTIYGKPDFIFRRAKIVVFVDGCFWHGCREIKKLPKRNGKFWQKKIQGNIERDKVVNITLRQEGWKIVRIWEHQFKKGNFKSIVKKLKF
jgi:DNA mismatch endonuclease, patch repair protein